jgi:hypothetical protein
MLNRLDDFPVHQTPDPLAVPATSDHNFYDRTWFNGYTADGEAYFGIGMAIYPHKGILDAALSTVRAGGHQHSFFASGRAPGERTDMSVGPFRIEVAEPMRTMRVILDENATGIACDLTFETRTAPIQEARQTLWAGTRRVMDATRFDQFGRWSGTIVDPDGDMSVDSWLGTKDRSWGTRTLGPQAPAAPGPLPRLFFLWAPLFWDDHVSHAIFFDGPDGEPLVREALTAPLFDEPEDVPDSPEPLDTRLARVAHDVRYHPGTRLASSASLEFTARDGATRRIELAPGLRFQMKGLGYLHPRWGHGTWHDELAIGSESFDPEDLDLLALENVHVQQVVTATDGERTGIGVLEQLAIGPYSPAGFRDFLDGA